MIKTLLSTALAVALALVVAVPCQAKNQSKKQKPLAGHVVLIGLDGWGAYSLPKADMPCVKKAMETGAYTLKKRSVLPSSSAMNWASMFNGAPIEIHGYMNYNSRSPELPSRVVNKRGIFPTIFSILREAEPQAEIGCVYDWSGIKFVTDTAAMSYQAQGPDYTKEPEVLTDMAVKYIKEKKPKLFAVCYDNPDDVGHEKGHDTPAYYEELNHLDARAARVVKAVEEAGFIDDTIFIFTADHGGINTGHGGHTLMEMETPFIITGKNVKAMGKFNESMMQYDVAATIAYIFGLTPPQVWTGRPMTQVFGK